MARPPAIFAILACEGIEPIDIGATYGVLSMAGTSPIGANLSLVTNLSLVMPRFKRGTQ
jgi:hypothetical protein